MLEKVKKKEAKEALKRATKQIHEGSDYDSDDSEYDETSSEDEDEVTDRGNGKRSRGNSNAEEMMSDEETKNGEGGGLGFTDKEEGNKLSDGANSDTSDDEYDNQVSKYYGSYFVQFELSVTVDQLKSSLLKEDEFKMFSDAVNALAQQRPNDITQILGQLSQKQVDELKKLLLTKRIVLGTEITTPVENNSEQAAQMDPLNQKPQEARRIIRVKRKAPPAT